LKGKIAIYKTNQNGKRHYLKENANF